MSIMTRFSFLKSQKKDFIGIWLISLLLATLAMIMIGAITRLTDSGLSMVEWRPLMGALPPLSELEWLRIFTLYQQIPEYQQSAGINLDDFKRIFFWEYMHRLWGRLLGIVFFVPWLYFIARNMLNRKDAIRFLLIPLLGGTQAVIGWWMVKSGFSERVDVSQYRLLVHLSVAVLIVMVIFHACLRYYGFISQKICFKWNHAMGFMLLLVITMIAGAFVAGTKAGLIYNQFPLMGEGIIPSDYLPIQGVSLSAILFENQASIQFHHRILAMVTFIVGILFFIKIRPIYHQYLLSILLLQFMIGIITLLTQLALLPAILHQLGAIMLLMVTWLIYNKTNEKSAV